MAPTQKRSKDEDSSQSTKRAKMDSSMSRSLTPQVPETKNPFEIKYPIMNSSKKLSRKEQELLDSAEQQISPFVAHGASKPGELDQYYSVSPAKEWNEMKKYNNFIIQGEMYKNSHFVFVRGAKETGTAPKDFWVARILQVRAKSAQQVYALVAWMYWPEELPPTTPKPLDAISKDSGHRKYHGRSELVASNYMEVLDVLSFAGKAEVEQWTEEGTGDELPKALYWRQTFCRETQRLSDIKKHCICGGHYNPDVPMFVCDNDKCKTMLHPDCLIDLALMKKYEAEYDTKTEEDSTETNGTSAKAKGKGPKGRKIYAGKFRGEIVYDEMNENKPTMLRITDLRHGVHDRPEIEQRIYCPICETALE